MLTITVPESEYYNEEDSTFVTVKSQTLQLEHSLVSLSKWESRWHKPFLSQKPHSDEEALDYIRCMTITQNVNPLVYYSLTQENLSQINAYIEDSMTATTFSNREGKRPSREIVTAEIIYYWMVSLQIPMECQKWHLNRLMTLIQVCDIKNRPPKKMGKKETISSYKALNEARRRKYGTRG